MKEEEAAVVVKELRASYGSGRTRALSWRLQQLNAISAMLLEQEHHICQALLQDLNKPPFETYYTEIAPIGNACKLAKDNLKVWTAPQKIKTIEDAIDFVNSRPKPLCLYLFTNDKSVKERVVHETSSGAVTVNDCIVQFALQVLPFGGIGESGMGAYHGKYSFETFSHLKPVLYRSFWGDIMARYPPFTQRNQSLLKAVVKFEYVRLFLILLGLKK